MGKLYKKTFLKTDLDTCWDFFSSPENLKRITPPSMGFTMKEKNIGKMFNGQKISYVVKPLLGIPLNWTTEIVSLTTKKEFVDTQLKGPFKIWHHRHIFIQKEGGVEMIDIVHYKVPFGFLGRIAERFIVRKKVKGIFDYRTTQIDGLFETKD